MNVKSFVNGLDPENTVKGYYDENDHLVMVEPEGSGGGGDFETAKLLINNRTGAKVEFPLYEESLISATSMSEVAESTFTVPVAGDGCLIYVENSNDVEITLDGDIAAQTTPPIPGNYIVTGDCTVTIESK